MLYQYLLCLFHLLAFQPATNRPLVSPAERYLILPGRLNSNAITPDPHPINYGSQAIKLSKAAAFRGSLHLARLSLPVPLVAAGSLELSVAFTRALVLKFAQFVPLSLSVVSGSLFCAH